MTRHDPIRKSCGAMFFGALLALPVSYSAAQQAKTPSTVNESAPARTGAATVPSGSGNQPLSGSAARSAYPPQTPSGANESAPARAGSAATPTGGQGQSAVGKTESINRLPQTPSSVSESAPARTGAATVPTARYTPMWSQADANNDGVIDRFEFDRWMVQQHSARR